MNDFKKEKEKRIAAFSSNKELKQISFDWLYASGMHHYAYNFSWFDRPIIQLPQDILAIQEIIWQVKPDIIIETGIAHGGSLIFNASMLALLDICDALEEGITINPKKSKRKVLGIDIDIRAHNRAAIEAHPISSHIHIIEGSSIALDVVTQVKKIAAHYSRILVCLDSNHTHDHVLAELEAYAPLTSLNSYCVVFDTVIEDMPADMFKYRPWGPGNNPKTAVWEYLKINNKFEIDRSIQNKLLLTVSPDGYLKKIK